MKIKDLIAGLKCKVFGDESINIESLFFDSRKRCKNGLFFALDGVNTSGENFTHEAIKNGAVAVVTQTRLNLNTTQIIVENTRKAMAIISANFFDNPEQKLKIIGITGTNGKTSTSYITAHLLIHCKKRVGIIGTSGIFVGNRKLETTMTTPDSIELFEILSQMVKEKMEYVVMEVSAHAIYLNKTFGIDYCAKVLTNVMTDHLDFFATQQNYEKTKKSFFETGKNFVVCGDDKIGKEICKKFKSKTVSFGKSGSCDLVIENEIYSSKGTNFSLIINSKTQKSVAKKIDIKTGLIGEFNVLNIACSIAILQSLGLKCDYSKSLANLNFLSGRMQNVSFGQKCGIIIDYAHTLDSLKNFLQAVKKISNNKNIIVFGCPGERDTQKRKQMGELAGGFCDRVILTTDNPASENARRIMWEMAQGVKTQNAKCFLIENRKKAIKKALELADENTNILIVGKGVERYQIVGDRKVEYNDFETVKSLLE
jgi:UDP-N-acetylmuramoyl-L-alanyl-D-glutamate--2,6-diaminopimelate ligase